MKKFARDINILHMCTKNHNHMRYSSWDRKWDKNFCHFVPFFVFLSPSPNNPQKHNFKKMEKTRSYDVCLVRYEVFAQTIFCHFRSVFAFYWPQKLKFGKNIKKHLDILSFRTCEPLMKIIWCMVPKIWSSRDRIFLSSWAFFCPFTPLTPWKWRYQKWKKPWRYHHFTQVYQKSWSSAILFQRYGTCRM